MNAVSANRILLGFVEQSPVKLRAGLSFRPGNTAAVKNAVEEKLSRIRDQESALKFPKRMNLIAFKANDKIFMFLMASGSYAMSRVETRCFNTRVSCNSILEPAAQFFATLRVSYN